MGGLSRGWEPVHAFCEQNEIPSLLPNTDYPGGIGTDDFYTLYFSEGLHLEARVLAADLAGLKQPVRVLQVYRPGENGQFGAESLQETVARIEGVSLTEWALEEGVQMRRAELLGRVREAGAETVVLWLPREELAGLSVEGGEQEVAADLYLSSSLLGGIFAPVPSALGKRLKVVHPFVLPQDQEVVFRRVQIWLKNKNIAADDPRVLGQTYYACMILGEGFMHIKRHFYRDYLLDALDHGNAKSIYTVNYPRLSYGPGQRYLAKGAYIIDYSEVGSDKSPAPATWIVPHL